ncbi:hypothetical protein [Enterovirga rhinocerotis]|uniref:Uncharacterized protein n=1 Tax=Enterovirga rhinocerotis TaxID=1339210 RepID=A0A4R7C878_9HYPH|nr:hypothetical protein [Enterovirga rhinocerotis]TDR94824.1 hypothetical protein EV668_2113 [Enterovirga rhinocerotis]
MIQIREYSGGLIYREEKLSLAARVFAGTIGLSMFGGCAIFLHLGRWFPPAWTDAIAVVAILAFAGVGAVGLFIAFSARKTLDFDAERRVIRRDVVSPLGSWRDEIPFARVEGIALHLRETEDGPFPLVRLTVAGARRPVELAGLGTPPQADAWRERIEALLKA